MAAEREQGGSRTDWDPEPEEARLRRTEAPA
jgi:hypothetical protein